jgi:hypothetical protein
MKKHKPDIKNILSSKGLEEFRSLGLIDEIALRNLMIKFDYKEMRVTQSQLDAISQLQEKYFLSYDNILSILFRPRARKKVLTS